MRAVSNFWWTFVLVVFDRLENVHLYSYQGLFEYVSTSIIVTMQRRSHRVALCHISNGVVHERGQEDEGRVVWCVVSARKEQSGALKQKRLTKINVLNVAISSQEEVNKGIKYSKQYLCFQPFLFYKHKENFMYYGFSTSWFELNLWSKIVNTIQNPTSCFEVNGSLQLDFSPSVNKNF